MSVSRSHRRHLAAATVVANVAALTTVGVASPGAVIDTLGIALVAATYSLVGALVLARSGTQRVGEVLAITGSLWLISSVTQEQTGVLYDVVNALGFMGGLICIAALLMWFPTGAVPSRRWRWLEYLGGSNVLTLAVLGIFAERRCAFFHSGSCVAWAANPIGISGVPGYEETALATGLLAVFIVGAATSLIARARSSQGLERQQLKWVALAAGVLIGALLLPGLYASISGANAAPPWLENGLSFSAMVAVPLSVGVAIMRYRLYEIDRIISRTVAYGLLATVTGAAFTIPVVVFPSLVGASDDLVVAASTLIAAALFNPARRRIQLVVERQFNRARYDADRAAEAFGATLRTTARLEDTMSELVAVVAHTLQPSHSTVWLRKRESRNGSGTLVA